MVLDLDLGRHAIGHAEQLDLDHAEARLETWTETSLLLRNGTLDASERSTDGGMAVRVHDDGGTGFASIDRPDRERVEEAVETAARNASSGRRDDPVALADVDPIDAYWKVDQEEDLEDLGIEERLEDLKHLDEAMTETADVPMRMIHADDRVLRKFVATTDGVEVRSVQPLFHLFTYVTVARNGDTRQAHRSFGYSGGWEGFEARDVVDRTRDEIAGLDRILDEGRRTRPREVTLVVGPEVAGIAAHESCGHPLEADRVLGREAGQAGTSFVDPSMVGDPIGDDQVTIVDDPLLEEAPGYHVYDDEGVPASERVLMDQGRIGELLHDRATAGELGIDSNGSSRANRYDAENLVRMSNTVVEPGDWSRDAILEEAGNGVYMRSFTEWNIDDRRYHQKYVAREAYRIEDGELGDPIPDLHIEVTTPGFWTRVEAIGDDLEWTAATCGKSDPMQGIPVATGGPTMMLDDVPVGVSSWPD